MRSKLPGQSRTISFLRSVRKLAAKRNPRLRGVSFFCRSLARVPVFRTGESRPLFAFAEVFAGGFFALPIQ